MKVNKLRNCQLKRDNLMSGSYPISLEFLGLFGPPLINESKTSFKLSSSIIL